MGNAVKLAVGVLPRDENDASYIRDDDEDEGSMMLVAPVFEAEDQTYRVTNGWQAFSQLNATRAGSPLLRASPKVRNHTTISGMMMNPVRAA